MTYEGIRLRILGYRRKAFAKIRRKKLKNEKFTIISNNCWGGMIYESYNLIKQTPTVGLYFFSKDYIKFISNIKEYLNEPIEFISLDQSKWKYKFLKGENRIGNAPIGRINDIEIFFLHYKNDQEVIEKWNRRIKRINWNHILFKFNDQNGCTTRDYMNFMKLPYKNKIFFTTKDWPLIDGEKKYIKIKQPFNKDHIMASYEPFGKNRQINITEIINNL